MRSGTKRVFAVLAAVFFIWLTAKFLLPLCFPFVLGTCLALAAEPAVRLLCGRLHIPRGIAAGIGVTAAFLGITVLAVMILAFLVRELRELAGILPDLTRTAHDGMVLLQNSLVGLTENMPQSIRPMLQQNVDRLFSGGTALLDRGFSRLLGMAGNMLRQVPDGALNFITAVISGYMISAKLPGIRRRILRSLSRERLRPILQSLRQIRSALGSWLMAQLGLTGVTFVILLLGMTVLRIPYGLLWAGGICLLDALPVLGTGAVLLPWGLILYLQGDKARAVGLLGIYTVITLTRSVLEPRMVGRQLGLDPLVTLFALYAGYRLWGIGGMILSPLLAVTVMQIFPENPKK